jgi:predicted transglutaminase-like cysteine proteinase
VVAQPAAPKPAASATSPASPLEGELDADKIMAAQKAGYQIKNENGQTLLCRKDLQTGSRLRHKTSCLTAREWEQLQNDNAQVLKAIERRPRMTSQ